MPMYADRVDLHLSDFKEYETRQMGLKWKCSIVGQEQANKKKIAGGLVPDPEPQMALR